MPGLDGSELIIRRAVPEDRPAVIDLCRASLGWREGDPNEAFFAWKHDENPFGASPAWVAVAPDGRLAGLRVFLRWRFAVPGGETIDAVRAVDTATHPNWQGKGIFTRLTLGALPDLQASGVGAVFNTPNDKSRPGYLKMGWQQLGTVPVAVRIRSATSARRLARARVPAEKWSIDSDVGLDARDVLADSRCIQRLIERTPTPTGIGTHRSADFLRWRYGFEPLHYRVLPLGDSTDRGLVVFRLRRRGDATELTVSDVVAPPRTSARAAVGYLLRRSGADYAIRGGGADILGDGFFPAKRLGPILTWRPLGRPRVPRSDELSLSLGDIELF